jgi:hypothetical protein
VNEENLYSEGEENLYIYIYIYIYILFKGVIKRKFLIIYHKNNHKTIFKIIKSTILKMERGRFTYEGCPILSYGFKTLKRSIQGRDVKIIISLDYNENYINIDLTIRLLILELNIMKRNIFFKLRNYK